MLSVEERRVCCASSREKSESMELRRGGGPLGTPDALYARRGDWAGSWIPDAEAAAAATPTPSPVAENSVAFMRSALWSAMRWQGGVAQLCWSEGGAEALEGEAPWRESAECRCSVNRCGGGSGSGSGSGSSSRRMGGRVGSRRLASLRAHQPLDWHSHCCAQLVYALRSAAFRARLGPPPTRSHELVRSGSRGRGVALAPSGSSGHSGHENIGAVRGALHRHCIDTAPQPRRARQSRS